MSIYTRGGDTGETGLFGGGRVQKDDARVDIYGAVDELNAVLGAARAAGLAPDLDALAGRLQNELFELGADLATPLQSNARSDLVIRLADTAPAALEREIDRLDAGLPPLTTFILPGGTTGAAGLHIARTVCRRAERRAAPLARAGDLSPVVIPYLNRLSDLLFVMARAANHGAGTSEAIWVRSSAGPESTDTESSE
ncbi:MAG: cob(I)yrinic acid a,c-diamide adenosyltransferase [Planctomycetota bacterium]